MSNNYNRAVKKLVSLSNLEKPLKWSSKAELETSLKRLRQFLHLLGDPHKRLKYVHVTGTSGKGTVTNLIQGILYAAGTKVGSYTSPHTTTYLERFKINDRLANPNELAKALNQVTDKHQDFLRQGGEPLTYFALSVCVALKLFANTKVAWAVMEVGMGGRYDDTNVIPAPAVAVITNIDFDHMQFLGNTKQHIALHKAGIIKPQSIVITGETASEPLNVIRAEAKKQHASLIVIPDHEHNHVNHNQDLARTAALSLGISASVVNRALEQAQPLPCRFETIQDRPLVIIDGAHNPAKMRATVAEWRRRGYPKAQVIMGCKGTKNALDMIKALSKITQAVVTTRFTEGHGQPGNPVSLLKLFPKSQRAEAFLDPFDALNWTLKHTPKNRPILITGSLYLAGQLRSHWRSEATILREQNS